MLRKSVLSNVVFSLIAPVRKPFAERAEGHEADAQLLQQSAESPLSGSRHHSEYSLCSAATGCTA